MLCNLVGWEATIRYDHVCTLINEWYPETIPTKMCNKSAPDLHQESTNLATVLIVLVLRLLNKNFFNYGAKFALFSAHYLK